jgi:glycosyltransferase involved in cell wall biosynthesis
VPIVVAPNGIDVGHVMAIAPAADACDLVVVSRLLRHKRVDLLLDAVALMAADGETVTCRVIGDGPEREALALHARELGIERQVEFRDDVGEHDELFALLKAARVFVFPSEREGFGIAALEALACGLPVVTTSAPDNLARHLVARSARGVVCAPEAAALARAIARALDGGGRSAAVEPWVREHDWDAVTDRVAEAVLG